MTLAIVGDVHIGNQVGSRIDDYFITCLDKLNQILSANDEVVVLGDLFNTPVLSLEKMQVVYSLFNNWKRKVWTIRGNHDVYDMNSDLSKTALGLLALTGVVTVIDDNQTVETSAGKVTALPLKFKDIAPIESEGVLIGHHFFDLNCSEAISRQQVEKDFSGFSHIFLGHDHKSYEPELIGNTFVVRPGSILRNACTDYNIERKPYYLQFEHTFVEGFKQIYLNAKPAEEIFLKSAFDRTAYKEKIFLESLDSLLNSRKEKKDFKTNKRSLKKIIQGLDIPEKSMDYLNRLHNRLQFDFT